ncbi:hypothetical protein DNH61_19355 [Paenibacillus sambharensis]|uniref:SPOR domain-containing protein n=1 Tax=Paenibacillus sambharensis TaxID=1803190 RepID=A0A2W1L5A8_9BACL|nr:SPOR domain-containing protein [Paenibacillus sambharensis]PZD94113.1 hypothetical protein DNH61_19355 [Paenibacillus sambharensis]
MKPKARITYRFDHKAQVSGRPSAENRVPPVSGSNVISLYPDELKFTTDVEAWKSPFQDDPAALEKLIRESEGLDTKHRDNRTDADRESGPQVVYDIEGTEDIQPAVQADREREDQDRADREPVQLIPLGDEQTGGHDGYETAAKAARDRRTADIRTVQDRQINSRTAPNVSPGQGDLPEPPVMNMDDQGEMNYTGYVVHRQQPGGPSWLKVIGSVGGALATGAVFGYLLLSLFSGDAILPSSESTGKVADEPVAINSPAPSKGAASLTAADIQGETYYLLQFGVFSQPEGMEAAIADLKNRGYSAAALQGDDFRVYAGMATTKAEAEMLAKQLGGLEVYVKPVDIPEVSGFPYNGDKQEAEQFAVQTSELANHLGTLTVTILEGGSETGAGEKWLDKYKAWKALHDTFRKGISTEGAEALSRIATAYESAAKSVSAYQVKESRSYLWQAQSALMEAVFAQKEWFGQF